MLRKELKSLVYLLITLFLLGCASKRDSSQDNQDARTADDSEWRGMDDFHMIMAETFHPYKDSADLEPAKARASELMVAAETWASAPLPAKVDNREMKRKLQQLTSEAGTLAQSVKSADDKTIGEQLTQLHDTFHEIQDEWYRKE